MTISDALDAIWKLSIIAGMNQRYHQHLETNAEWWDSAIRIVVALIAVASASVSIWSACKTKQQTLANWSAGLSIFSLAVAVWLNISSWSDTARHHADLHRRWSDLREEVDDAMDHLQGDGEDTPAPAEIVDEVAKLTAKKNRLNALEGAPDRELLGQFQREEEQWRSTADSRSDSRSPIVASTD